MRLALQGNWHVCEVVPVLLVASILLILEVLGVLLQMRELLLVVQLRLGSVCYLGCVGYQFWALGLGCGCPIVGRVLDLVVGPIGKAEGSYDLSVAAGGPLLDFGLAVHSRSVSDISVHWRLSPLVGTAVQQH